jgi:hypothetical protein
MRIEDTAPDCDNRAVIRFSLCLAFVVSGIAGSLLADRPSPS